VNGPKRRERNPQDGRKETSMHGGACICDEKESQKRNKKRAAIRKLDWPIIRRGNLEIE
jgi:hypothetical protein